MQDRNSQDNDSNDVSSRLTLKYLAQIDAAINEIRPLTEKKSSFLVNDGLEDVRAAIESVDRTIAQVKPQITSYENHRKPLLVDMNFYDERQAAQTRLDDALSRLKNIQPAFEKEKQQLTNEIDQLHEERQRINNEETTRQVIKIEESSNDIRKLREQELALNNRRNKLDLKIQTKCCHCIPSAVKKEVKELNQIQNSLKDIKNDISIKQNEINNIKINPEVDAVEKKRKKAILKRKKLINNFPKTLEKSEKEVAQARKKLARLSAKRAKMEKQHLRDVNREIMFDIIHLFGRFNYIKNLISDGYIKVKQNGEQTFESSKHYQEKMENLDSAIGLMEISSDKILRRLKHIRCEQSNNCRGSDVYKRLDNIPASARKQFIESDYSPNELMDTVLPAQEKKERIEVTVDNIASAKMSSMNLFFKPSTPGKALSDNSHAAEEALKKTA